MARLVGLLVLAAVLPHLAQATNIPVASSVAGHASESAGSPAGVDATTVQVVDRGVGDVVDRGILEFDITFGGLGFPLCCNMVTLELYRDTTAGDLSPSVPYEIDVYGYGADGLLTQSDFGLGTLIGSFTYSNQASISLGVTGFVFSLAGAYDYAGFNLRKRTGDGDAVALFDGLAQSQPPVLRFTPEPGTSLLLAGVLLGLGLRRWRRPAE